MELQISFNDVDIVAGYYYAASNMHNGLYRFNEEGCELICKFGDEPNIANLFLQTILYDDKIIFTPSSAKGIYIYDIRKNEMFQISLIDKMVMVGKFHGVTMWNNFAIFICHNYPALVKLNLDTYETEYLEEPVRTLQNGHSEIIPAFTYGYVQNDILYVTRIFENIILEVELKTGVLKIRRLDNIVKKIWGYFIDGDIEYILSSEGFFVMQKDNICYFQKVENLDGDKYLFSTCMDEESIYFIPYKVHYAAIPFKVSRYIDSTTTMEIKPIIRNSKCMFGCVKQTNGKLYMLLSRNGRFIEYRIGDETIIEHKSNIKRDMVVESDMYKLSEWITLL